MPYPSTLQAVREFRHQDLLEEAARERLVTSSIPHPAAPTVVGRGRVGAILGGISMDGDRFDAITRLFSTNPSRRQILTRVAGSGAGALLARLGVGAATAKDNGKKKGRKKDKSKTNKKQVRAEADKDKDKDKDKKKDCPDGHDLCHPRHAGKSICCPIGPNGAPVCGLDGFDEAVCGACAGSCPTPTDPWLKCCSGTCIRVQFNDAHCGECGRACTLRGDQCCDGVCTSLFSGPNCYGCGNACDPGETCCTDFVDPANNECCSPELCVSGQCRAASCPTPCPFPTQVQDPLTCVCSRPGACPTPCPNGQIQDPFTCQCRPGACPTPCAPGETQDPATCACLPGDCPTPCPASKPIQDPVSCQCSCEAKSCPTGKILNDSCDCVCSSPRCVGGKTPDPDSCECACAVGQHECEGDGNCYPECTGQRSFNGVTCQCDCNAGLEDCGATCCKPDGCLQRATFPPSPPICCADGPACQSYGVCCGFGEECTDVHGCCRAEWVCDGLLYTSCCDPNQGLRCEIQSDGGGFCVSS